MAIRDALNLKSRKPFRWGGLKGYDQLVAISNALEEVAYDEEETDFLFQLKTRIKQVIRKHHNNAQDIEKARALLLDIADVLRYPPSDKSPAENLTSTQVKQEMEDLLEDFQATPKHNKAQKALYNAWNRIWKDYGPSNLLPCYDIPGLTQDNLEMEALFGKHRRRQRRISGRKVTHELGYFGQYQIKFLAESEEDLLEEIRLVSPEEYRKNRVVSFIDCIETQQKQ